MKYLMILKILHYSLMPLNEKYRSDWTSPPQDNTACYSHSGPINAEENYIYNDQLSGNRQMATTGE